MRLIILTHNLDRHFYFANRLIEGMEESGLGEVVGVITGGKKLHGHKWKKLRSRYVNKHFRQNVRNLLLNRQHADVLKALQAEKDAAEHHFFGGAKERFEAGHKQLILEEVRPPFDTLNHPYYIKLIRHMKPTAICVMGTCMVGEGIIESAPLVLNIHTGLSPYYRGDRSNFWPFLQQDFGYFGVTVHRMSLGIDSGDIVYSDRVHPEKGEGFPEINCRAITRGSDLMLKALGDHKAGNMQRTAQWESGKLFYNRDFNALRAKEYLEVKGAYLDRYHAMVEAGELDEVRLVGEGGTL